MSMNSDASWTPRDRTFRGGPAECSFLRSGASSHPLARVSISEVVCFFYMNLTALIELPAATHYVPG
jgi:hypothetical protein